MIGSDVDNIEHSLQGINLLVVEDIGESRQFLCNFLTRRGATVHTAENGQQGFAAFQEYHPDIVLTDIRMPVMDGLEMVSAIRALDDDMPVIFLTAHTDSDLLKRSIDLGISHYLIKPVTTDKLLFALRAVIDKVNVRRQLQVTVDALSRSVNYNQEVECRLEGMIRNIIGRDDHVAVQVLHQAKDKISGDLYCIEESRHALYALLADGMGHGPTAILPALNLPTAFRKLARKGFSLSRIADELNHLLIEQSRDLNGHFVTATLLRIDSEHQLLEVINCGNPPALSTDLNGKLLLDFPSNHLPWGIVDGDDFLPELQTCRYQTPFHLYLFSDGLTDTLRYLEKRPGLDVLTELITAKPTQVLTNLENRLHGLHAGQRQNDITLLHINSPLLRTAPIEPLQSEAPTVPDQPGGRDEALKNLSLLYVEDDEKAREFLARFLERRVGAVYVAANGEEGLQLFKRHRPQLVITDMVMPVMDGLRMVEEIRRIDANTQIILTSGVASWQRQQEKLETLLKLTVNQFLPKPLSSEKLLEAINSCLSHYDYVSSLHISASVFMTSPLAITVTDANRNIIVTNPAFTTITGYSPEEVIGCNPRILSSGKHDADFYIKMWDSINETGHWSGELWNRRKNGELFLEWINITVIHDAQGKVTHYASVFSDITQRAVAEEKIRHLAHHDPLTNLPNRALFRDRLGQALLQAQREQTKLAVVYLDVDHFKGVNDALGHGAGDELICAVAGTLQETIRESDTVSRLGGDEFAILLPDIGSATMANRLIMKIFNAVSRNYSVAGKDLRVSVSMGVSLYPRDGDNTETLVKRADNAMYLAKRKGRNNYQFFDVALEQQAERQMAVQQGLHKALEQAEFAVYYQPKYDLDERRIVGLEALLRWHSPELHDVSPAEFIPLAEESGLIIEIGNWVIDQVCRDLAEWLAYGIDVVKVAINVSPIHFHRGNIQRSLQETLNNHRLSPSLLQIELTEGAVMDNLQNTLVQLQAIKDMGITISIDDFGTGYSSLSYLRKLPIDELKIDRSFIMEITNNNGVQDSRLTAVPSAIIELANSLQLNLVAEGVETEAQSEFLQGRGCPVIQGYLFSRPIDKEAMRTMLIKKNIV